MIAPNAHDVITSARLTAIAIDLRIDDIQLPFPTESTRPAHHRVAWPLGYAFSGPLSAEQRKTLDQTYAALHRHGLGFTRVYIGDYRTGLVFDAAGSVAGVEPWGTPITPTHAFSLSCNSPSGSLGAILTKQPTTRDDLCERTARQHPAVHL